MDEHACGQGQTLAVICQKIEEIRNDIEDIKQDQKEYLTKCQAADISRAKYPTPEVVNKQIAAIGRHETYFKIVWILLSCAWGLLLVFAATIIPKLM